MSCSEIGNKELEFINLDPEIIDIEIKDFFNSVTYSNSDNLIIVKYKNKESLITVKIHKIQKEELKFCISNFKQNRKVEKKLFLIFDPLFVQKNFFIEICSINFSDDLLLLNNCINLISMAVCLYGIEIKDLPVSVCNFAYTDYVDDLRYCAAFRGHEKSNLYFFVDNCDFSKEEVTFLIEFLRKKAEIAFFEMKNFLKKESKSLLK